jgi:hypothetical protein
MNAAVEFLEELGAAGSTPTLDSDRFKVTGNQSEVARCLSHARAAKADLIEAFAFFRERIDEPRPHQQPPNPPPLTDANLKAGEETAAKLITNDNPTFACMEKRYGKAG